MDLPFLANARLLALRITSEARMLAIIVCGALAIELLSCSSVVLVGFITARSAQCNDVPKHPDKMSP
jgi:hypothetical protein